MGNNVGLAIQFLRAMQKEPQKEWTGLLEDAIRDADEFAEKYGMKAYVIRKKNKYDWVTEYFFDTYKYNGKIYYETA